MSPLSPLFFKVVTGLAPVLTVLQAVALLLGYTTITASMVAALQPNDGAYVVDTSPQSVHNRVYQCAIH